MLLYTVGCFAFLIALTATQSCSPGPVDVMFVLSSDSTLDRAEFRQKINVVEEFVRNVHIGPDEVRVGLITEYNFPDLEFHMNDHMDKQELSIAINFTYFQGGVPKFGSGLQYITDHGMDMDLGGRPGVPDVVIFLTDGIPTDTTLAENEAKKLTDKDVTVISLGGGRIDKDDLVSVASGCHYVAQTPLFTENILAHAAVNLTCDALNRVPLDDCECKLVADIVFLLDASAAQGKNNFKEQIKFAKTVVSELNVASNETRIAAVTYSTFYHYQFGLNSHSDKAEVQLALSYIPFQADDDRNLHNGLQYIADNHFLTGIPSRTNAEKIIILTATGPLTDPQPSKTEAMLLKNLGLTIYSIDIGNVNQNHLGDLAFSYHFYKHFNKFDQLVRGALPLAKALCQHKIWSP